MDALVYRRPALPLYDSGAGGAAFLFPGGVYLYCNPEDQFLQQKLYDAAEGAGAGAGNIRGHIRHTVLQEKLHLEAAAERERAPNIHPEQSPADGSVCHMVQRDGNSVLSLYQL